MGEFKFTLINKTEIPASDLSSRRNKYEDMVEMLLENPEKSVRIPTMSKAKAQLLRVSARAAIENLLNKRERGRWKVHTKVRGGVVFISTEDHHPIPNETAEKIGEE